LGFRPAGRESEHEAALRSVFTPEFLGRLDKIVCFRNLTDAAMVRIAQKYLQELCVRGKRAGIRLQLPEELPTHLKNLCTNRGGARQLRHLVQEKVEGPLAQYLLKTEKSPAKICGKLEHGVLQFSS
jgi:ATP-dependent Clp protease ATP-binding subunit ClpC